MPEGGITHPRIRHLPILGSIHLHPLCFSQSWPPTEAQNGRGRHWEKIKRTLHKILMATYPFQTMHRMMNIWVPLSSYSVPVTRTPFLACSDFFPFSQWLMWERNEFRGGLTFGGPVKLPLTHLKLQVLPTHWANWMFAPCCYERRAFFAALSLFGFSGGTKCLLVNSTCSSYIRRNASSYIAV